MRTIFGFLAILAFLLLSFSVFYYLVLYLPKHNRENENSRQLQEKEEELYSRKNQCADDGRKYFSGEVKKNLDNDYWEPEFHYNNKLRKCLVYLTYTWGIDKSFGMTEYIIDVHTGEELGRLSVTKGIETTKEEKGSFEELKNELLAE